MTRLNMMIIGLLIRGLMLNIGIAQWNTLAPTPAPFRVVGSTQDIYFICIRLIRDCVYILFIIFLRKLFLDLSINHFNYHAVTIITIKCFIYSIIHSPNIQYINVLFKDSFCAYFIIRQSLFNTLCKLWFKKWRPI